MENSYLVGGLMCAGGQPSLVKSRGARLTRPQQSKHHEQHPSKNRDIRLGQVVEHGGSGWSTIAYE